MEGYVLDKSLVHQIRRTLAMSARLAFWTLLKDRGTQRKTFWSSFPKSSPNYVRKFDLQKSGGPMPATRALSLASLQTLHSIKDSA